MPVYRVAPDRGGIFLFTAVVVVVFRYMIYKHIYIVLCSRVGARAARLGVG